MNVTIKVLQLSEDQAWPVATKERPGDHMMSHTRQAASNWQSGVVMGCKLASGIDWLKISIRKFGGCTCLSTTAQSRITIVPDVLCTVAQIMENFDWKGRWNCHSRGEGRLFVPKTASFIFSESGNITYQMSAMWYILPFIQNCVCIARYCNH